MRISDWSSDVCSSDLVVTNQQAAEGLKPWYGMLCKRPTFHDDYLQAFNQPNVTLVDTQGRGLDRITETGIVFDGVEYPVDCIIFATGFESGTNYARRSEEHTSELQSLMRISYAVFCLK